MIRKQGKGYVVLSEEGKHLGGPYADRAEAERRRRSNMPFCPICWGAHPPGACKGK